MERRLDSRGFMNRFLDGPKKTVIRPWKIHPIGVLFNP